MNKMSLLRIFIVAAVVLSITAFILASVSISREGDSGNLKTKNITTPSSSSSSSSCQQSDSVNWPDDCINNLNSEQQQVKVNIQDILSRLKSVEDQQVQSQKGDQSVLIKQQQDQLDKQEQQISKLQSILQDYSQQIDVKQNQLLNMTSQLNDKQNQINALQAQFDKLNQQLNNSNSIPSQITNIQSTLTSLNSTLISVANSIPATYLYDTIFQKQWWGPFNHPYTPQSFAYDLSQDVIINTTSIVTLTIIGHMQQFDNNIYISFAVDGIPIAKNYYDYQIHNTLQFAHHSTVQGNIFMPVNFTQKIRLEPRDQPYKITLFAQSDVTGNTQMNLNGAGIQIQVQTVPKRVQI